MLGDRPGHGFARIMPIERIPSQDGGAAIDRFYGRPALGRPEHHSLTEAIMIEEIKKGLMTGIGAVLLTKEKIEESVDKLVKESKIKEEDARKLVEELAGTGQKQASKIEKDVGDVFKKALSGMNVARKDEITELRRQIDALEVRLSILEGREEGNG
jgi:polyhydroxyalkanoate synthesis regulator phasin